MEKAQRDGVSLEDDSGKVLAWKAVYINNHQVPRILESYLNDVYAIISPAIQDNSLTLDEILEQTSQPIEPVVAERDGLRSVCPDYEFLDDLWK